MTDRSGHKQGPQDKSRRLSAALRDNLKRRKAQAKGRAKGSKGGAEMGRNPAAGGAGSTGANAAAPHDSAGIGDEK